MADRPIIERVVFNGVEMPLADALPPADAAEEENMRISELIDVLEESEGAQFLLSTSSSDV
jgi:hypothetical protein